MIVSFNELVGLEIPSSLRLVVSPQDQWILIIKGQVVLNAITRKKRKIGTEFRGFPKIKHYSHSRVILEHC